MLNATNQLEPDKTHPLSGGMLNDEYNLGTTSETHQCVEKRDCFIERRITKASANTKII